MAELAKSPDGRTPTVLDGPNYHSRGLYKQIGAGLANHMFVFADSAEEADLMWNGAMLFLKLHRDGGPTFTERIGKNLYTAPLPPLDRAALRERLVLALLASPSCPRYAHTKLVEAVKVMESYILGTEAKEGAK